MIKRISFAISLAVLFVASSCMSGGFPFKREIREGRNISSFTIDANFLYFGAGYKLYRLDLSAPSVETVYSTDRILVEQPVIADAVVYFGGITHSDKHGSHGEKQGLFAVDLQSNKAQWKFLLGVGGYGTFGTYPVVAGDRILVCARQHLHSLDRKSGKELWKLDNWFGNDADGRTLPYVYKDSVFFIINEEYFTKSDEIDGNWARVALDSGQRIDVLRVAQTPGKYHDTNGQGVGRLVDGVIYGATRYHGETYPASRFGALDLESGRFLWEVPGSSLRTRPAVNDKFVFTVREDSIQALDRKSGKVKWSESLGEIAQTNIDRSQDGWNWDYENQSSRRFDATNEVVVAQGSKGIAARQADTGKLIWQVKTESDYRNGDADPLIYRQAVIASSAKDCSIFALDLNTGKELWRVMVPDCTYYYVFDD
jgi:outer membrane protein assembly factor BamB